MRKPHAFGTGCFISNPCAALCALTPKKTNEAMGPALGANVVDLASTPQLPYRKPSLPSNADPKALNGTLGVAGRWRCNLYSHIIYTYTHTSTYTYTHTHMYTRTYIHMYMHIYIHIHIHRHIRIHIHTFVRSYVRTYVHAYIRTYIRTYVHTYRQT